MPGLDPALILESPVFELMAFAIGLIVGSFANVCIHRLPLERPASSGRLARWRDLLHEHLALVTPGSHCPRCGAPIRPWDNVPVLSWLLLRGRCRSCHAPISIRYPVVEATNGVLWLALAWLRGPQTRTFVEMLLVTALLVLLLIDLEHQLLPDAVTLPSIAAGLAASVLPGSPVRLLSACAAALGGYLGFAGLAWAWKRLRGIDALGQGDWKMAAMLGAFLGGQKLLLTLLLASTAGSLVGIVAIALGRGGWRTRLPLGSFLGAAAILVVLLGDPILAWYEGLLHG